MLTTEVIHLSDKVLFSLLRLKETHSSTDKQATICLSKVLMNTLIARRSVILALRTSRIAGRVPAVVLCSVVGVELVDQLLMVSEENIRVSLINRPLMRWICMPSNYVQQNDDLCSERLGLEVLVITSLSLFLLLSRPSSSSAAFPPGNMRRKRNEDVLSSG